MKRKLSAMDGSLHNVDRNLEMIENACSQMDRDLDEISRDLEATGDVRQLKNGVSKILTSLQAISGTYRSTRLSNLADRP